MGLGRSTSFFLTENVMLKTSLVDVLKLYEDASQCIPGGANSRGDTGGDLCHKADQTPPLLSESSETARGPAQRLWHN